ncbi:MAG TPA: ATP-binding protein [Candidatus Avibacteroides avistercoris]|uniref:ATP-binding protein n=1 Tax=Candidatus Avibacteroides avistercoris TaxID=2840690 RepID=A0A9D2UJG8_9BACT|nr:ATP-binding protein [Candidatus Avibacteroides avistercoris]
MRHTAAEDYLKRLIAEGEHERQDFKYEVSDARKIARSLSAFANTSGGRLLVGVKDNGRIAGIDSDEEYYMVQAAAEVCCTPVPNVEMQAVTAAGKTVLIATVHEADDKPVRVIDADGRRTAYVRRADENVLASPVHIRVWEQQRRPHGETIVAGSADSRLMQQLARGGMLDINKFAREAHIPRRAAVQAMARLVRYGVAEEVYAGHKFWWRAV